MANLGSNGGKWRGNGQKLSKEGGELDAVKLNVHSAAVTGICTGVLNKSPLLGSINLCMKQVYIPFCL